MRVRVRVRVRVHVRVRVRVCYVFVGHWVAALPPVGEYLTYLCCDFNKIVRKDLPRLFREACVAC